MDFTVRLLLGTILVLLSSWSIETTQLNRPVRQVSNNGDNKTSEKFEKVEVENGTQSTVVNLTEDSTKPKTDFSTESNQSIDKENSVVGKLQKSESYKKAASLLENAKSLDIEKYISNEFHNKNNVYTLPVSQDTEKYITPDFEFHATTHKHDFAEGFDYHTELTTPKSSLFDHKFKEAVESVDQKLEHIDDSLEMSSEAESNETINVEKLYEETQKNDTKADLNFINYKNIISNDTENKNSVRKDLVVEDGTNLNFHSSYNQTTVFDEDDNGNNTIVKEPEEEKKVETSTLSNIIPAKGDLDNSESSTSKSIVLTTRKSVSITKPPSNNSSHVSILSNNIESETVKAINPVELSLRTTTENSKGETVSVVLPMRTPIDIAKRPYLYKEIPTTEATVDTNHINRKPEQLQQENQIVPVHVEPPPHMKKNITTEPPSSEKSSQTTENIRLVKEKTNEINDSSLKPHKFVTPMKEENQKIESTSNPEPRIEKVTMQSTESNTSEIATEIVKLTEAEEEFTPTPKKEMKVTTEPVTKVEELTESAQEFTPTPQKEMKVTTEPVTKVEELTESAQEFTPTPKKEMKVTTEPATKIEEQTESAQEFTRTSEREMEIVTIETVTKIEASTKSAEEFTPAPKNAAKINLTEKIPETTVTPEIETTTVSSQKPVNSIQIEAAPTNLPNESEIETITSIVTETSISPWEKVTIPTAEVETKTLSSSEYEIELTTINIATETPEETAELETTTTGTTYLADSTAATETVTEATIKIEEESTTFESVASTVSTSVKTSESDVSKNTTVTTENSIRTSKEMVYKEVTTPYISATTITEEITTVQVGTEEPEVTKVPQTTQPFIETTYYEATELKNELPETTTTIFVPVTYPARIRPDFRHITDSSPEPENTTDNNTTTSEFYEHTNRPEDNSGTIAAITISSIGAVCLVLLAGLLVIMRKRQKGFNYGQRCRPVNLDDYSMDNVSVYNSVTRKAKIRGSTRSYGNPAFEDPASVSHPLNFPALGKFATDLEDIKAEFEEVPQITARTNELPEGCDTKNRYANVIPLPESRVFLSLIDGYPNSDYINANYVTGPKNIKGYYIACQAPMQNTVDDFWRMIWEQQSKVILMLTHLFENGVEKCVDYLPPSEVLDCHRLFGDFQITLKKREVKDKYIISSLQLKNMVSNSWREVTHFWYLGWPEKGVPFEGNSLIAFLIEARSYMKSSSLDSKDVTNGNLTNGIAKNEINPVVVHCSPGTGRTGVVIACDIAIREFEQARLVDIPKIVYKIRRDRASAVQTKEQYAFIYKVVSLYATKLTGGALDSL